MSSAPKIKLYTNHGCPWAHRAHVALTELGLPYEEEIIDLAAPRTQEYLEVNPRGLVPSLSYDGEIITESAVVVQFLADAHPSHLVPASNAEGGPLRRARINFFVDAYFTKANPFTIKVYTAKSQSELDAAATSYAEAIAKDVEPLLKDAGPYFGGSAKPTLVEVLTGPFLLRIFAFAKHELLPPSLITTLEQKTPNFFKWAQIVTKIPSVTHIWNEDYVIEGTKWRIANLRAAGN